MTYKLEYCDGYYITKNGKGVIDFAEDVDGEFANFVLGLLQQRRTKRKPLSGRSARGKNANEQILIKASSPTPPSQ